MIDSKTNKANIVFNAACIRRAELHNTRASPGLAEIEQWAEHILPWHTEDCKPPLHKISETGFDSQAQSTWLHQKPARRLLYFLSSLSAPGTHPTFELLTCHTSASVIGVSVATKLKDWAAFNLAYWYHKIDYIVPVLVVLYFLHRPSWQMPCQRICNGAVRCVWLPLWVIVNRLIGLNKQQQLIPWVAQPHIWLVRLPTVLRLLRAQLTILFATSSLQLLCICAKGGSVLQKVQVSYALHVQAWWQDAHDILLWLRYTRSH